jgi:hypothetical protein
MAVQFYAAYKLAFRWLLLEEPDNGQLQLNNKKAAYVLDQNFEY